MKSASLNSAFRLAWPASLAAMITPLLGVVDSAVLARAGSPADIAGVALASAVVSLLYWPLAFIRMSTAGQVARAHGEEDEAGLRAYLVQGLVLGAVLGLIVLVLRAPITQLAAVTMADDAVSAEALSAMGTFLEIRFLAAPFAIASTAAAGWLSGQGRTGLMGAAIIGTVILNGVLDIWFVLGLEMGVAGIALGTVLAEVFSLVAMGVAILFVLHQRGGISRDWQRDRLTHDLQGFFALNANIFIRTLLLSLTFAWFMRAGSRFGDLTLAANQILMQIVLVTGLALDGPAIAAESLVGTALGRKEHRAERFTAAVRATAILTTIFAGLLFLALLIGRAPALAMVIPQGAAPDLRREVELYYIWAAVSPLILALPFYLDGVFIGATRGPELRNSMALSLLLFAVSAYGLQPLLGNHGLWLAFGIFMLARAGTLMLWWGKVTALAR
ncbi:MATE family efflux transporter [Parvularcula marina]|uniref:MATE family efflux transporter n=1 Tax=Parvularcula marina TaxID=2292771 RepID=UPI0035155FA8